MWWSHTCFSKRLLQNDGKVVFRKEARRFNFYFVFHSIIGGLLNMFSVLSTNSLTFCNFSDTCPFELVLDIWFSSVNTYLSRILVTYRFRYYVGCSNVYNYNLIITIFTASIDQLESYPWISFIAVCWWYSFYFRISDVFSS